MYYFFHRAAAALFAISLLCFFVSAAARAFPPFGPPILPIADAAAWIGVISFTGSGGSIPVVLATSANAVWFRSRRLLDRVGMTELYACHGVRAKDW